MAKNGSGISKVLIAYDGSGFAHGVLSELRLSELPQEAHVVIISVCETWLPPVNPPPEVPFDREMAEYFQKHGEQVDRNMAEVSMIADQAREELLRYFPDWSIEIDVVTGSPAREILKKAAEFQPDLIVVAERGLSSDQTVGLGSTAQTVLSNAKCSVRIARLKLDARSQQRIVIGFDASPGSMAAARMVASRTWTTTPEIRLLTITDPFTLLNPGRAFDPIPGMTEWTMEGEEKWVQMLAMSALQILRDSGLSATSHSYSGNPRMILTREAKTWDADTIFLGAHSLELQLQSSSLGCVALAVANRASCSVEVVRNSPFI